MSVGDPGRRPAAGLISFQHRRFANAGATIGDAGAVGAVIEPGAVRTEPLPVRVELAGTWSRGRTVVDRRDWSGHLAHDPHGLAATMVDVALDHRRAPDRRPLGRTRARGRRRDRARRWCSARSTSTSSPASSGIPGRARRCSARACERLAGGKGANQAVGGGSRRVRRSRCSAASATTRAAPPTALGSTGLGIDVSGRARRAQGAPTGHALITVDDDGENSIVVIPGANDLLDEREVAAVDALGPGDVLLVQLEVPRAVVCTAVRRAARVGAPGSCSTPPRMPPCPPDVVALADPVVVNEHEMAALAEAGAEPRSLLVTFGANGAALGRRDAPGPRGRGAEVVDTTGAGDAFCGALAAALAVGADARWPSRRPSRPAQPRSATAAPSPTPWL